jgi:hypothetical protein
VSGCDQGAAVLSPAHYQHNYDHLQPVVKPCQLRNAGCQLVLANANEISLFSQLQLANNVAST